MPYRNSRAKKLTDLEKALLFAHYANPQYSLAELEKLTGQKPGTLARLKARKQGRGLLEWAKQKGPPEHFIDHLITEERPVSYKLQLLGVKPAANYKPLDLNQFLGPDDEPGEDYA